MWCMRHNSKTLIWNLTQKFMVHFLQLKFQIAFLILRKSQWLVSCGEEKGRGEISREKEKLFIHFVFRHNIISNQILSKCWGYSYLLRRQSFLMDRIGGHFPHHPAFSTLISGFRSLKFYWLYKNCRPSHRIFFTQFKRTFLYFTHTYFISFCDPFWLW